MKVASKLVKMDFSVGKIERKDQFLIIYSDPEKSTMSTKVRVDATDVWAIVKAGLKWSVIKYILALPWLYHNEEVE